MTAETPLISIIVPLYKVEPYLRRCLGSIVNQTYQNLEIICVNDCSTDKSLEILEEYAAKDKQIKIITNEKNCGLRGTTQRGDRAAHGEYIFFIDSDDLAGNRELTSLNLNTPEKVEELFLEEYIAQVV